MLQLLQVNWQNIILYQRPDFVGWLKPDKDLRQEDLNEIERLFDAAYVKYLNDCKWKWQTD